MAVRQDSLVSYSALIHESYKQSGLSVEKLWRRYLLMGGELGTAAFRSWMKMESGPQPDDFARVCSVLNNRLRELGKEPLLPDLAVPSVPPADGGLESPPSRSHIPGYLRAVG